MLYVKKLVEKAIIPKKGSLKAAGYDLYSAEDTLVPAKGKQLIKTGIAMALTQGTYGRIAPRSGLAAKNFIDVGAGVIDEDYRGEICVLLFNFGELDFKVNYGDRIAQMVIEYVVQTEIVETDNLGETQRGDGGFGSTGVKHHISQQVQIENQQTHQNQLFKQNNPEAWQEHTILDLYDIYSNGLINSQQKQKLGEITLKGDTKVYELIKKNDGKNQKIISQQLLNLLDEN